MNKKLDEATEKRLHKLIKSEEAKMSDDEIAKALKVHPKTVYFTRM